MGESKLWVEKYRPENLDEYQGNTKKVEEVKDWVQNWHNRKSQSLLMPGPPGSGKTALVYVVANELGYEVYETNASDVRTKKALKEKVMRAVKQRSLTGKTKIILIDEVDGMSSKDRGGKSEINRIIEKSKFPVILTANDAYANGMQSIRKKSKVVELGKVHTNSVNAKLKEITEKEGIEYEKSALKSIARHADGDMRSAINDLESLGEKHDKVTREEVKELGYRDTEKDIFEALKIIFKTGDAETASDATEDLSEGPDEILQWIRENIPKEYKKQEDVARAMEEISKADLFNGRIRKSQNWSLLKYVYSLMTVGVALSKEEKYKGFTRYSYPSRIKKMGQSKSQRKKRQDIGEKIGENMHISISKAVDILPFLQVLFQREGWKKSIAEELELTEDEVEFIEEL
ncbi:MAG: replication factor C large subunit [Candidatus Nanohaloarchaeota archaeon QJJ-9]|nr:replication factor C large subunit [Candidatus Nanohaloarchaeota archaeon QJJ-9]